MADNEKKYSAWWMDTLFGAEAIRPRPAQEKPEPLPPMLRTARALEHPSSGIFSREAVFLKQARLLAPYEDDYAFSGNLVRYFPTYQSLTDSELRGYFSWRTKLRRGQPEKGPLTFAFLYIYELLNQIGFTDPMEGYRKLVNFRDTYQKLDSGILMYLNRWLVDYVVYYNLDPALLAEHPQVIFDRSITILDHISEQPPEKVRWAVGQLAPKWLGRSRFYAAHSADFDTVLVRVLEKMSEHYAARCKKTMVEQLFGTCATGPVQMFESAVFCDPLRAKNRVYMVDERWHYRCRNGLWTVTKHTAPLRPNGKLEDLVKAIDAIMREESHYGHPIQYRLDTKWMLKLIRQEVQALLAEQKETEARKISIDYSILSQIRRDAAITQQKLTVEEELEEEPIPEPVPEPEPAATDESCPLSGPEYRLLQCLLYGRDWSWVAKEGFLLSVLLDGINDKLYDTFLDSVVADGPEVIGDYIDDLKEMVHP